MPPEGQVQLLCGVAGSCLSVVLLAFALLCVVGSCLGGVVLLALALVVLWALRAE